MDKKESRFTAKQAQGINININMKNSILPYMPGNFQKYADSKRSVTKAIKEPVNMIIDKLLIILGEHLYGSFPMFESRVQAPEAKADIDALIDDYAEKAVNATGGSYINPVLIVPFMLNEVSKHMPETPVFETNGDKGNKNVAPYEGRSRPEARTATTEDFCDAPWASSDGRVNVTHEGWCAQAVRNNSSSTGWCAQPVRKKQSPTSFSCWASLVRTCSARPLIMLCPTSPSLSWTSRPLGA